MTPQDILDRANGMEDHIHAVYYLLGSIHANLAHTEERWNRIEARLEARSKKLDNILDRMTIPEPNGAYSAESTQ
jgi:septation ring formation regulator EzrA